MGSARTAPALLRLQQQCGNRSVGRLLAMDGETAGATVMAPETESAIEGALGSGQPLDREVRGQVESVFNADFDDVRVHADGQADHLSRALEARAFTVGHDVFFRHGAYDTGTSPGRRLLAHELTHVVQQGAASVRRKLAVSQPGDRFEQEAERVSTQVEIALQERTAEEVKGHDPRS